MGTATLEHRFVMRNTGGAPLVIHDVKKTCSCVVEEVSDRVLQPGQEGHIDIRLELATIAIQAKTGIIERSVAVESNDPVASVVQLTLRGTRERNHFYYPAQVDFHAVPLAKSATQDIHYIPKADFMGAVEPKVETTAEYLSASIERVRHESNPFAAEVKRASGDFDFALSDSAYPRDGYVIHVTLSDKTPAGEFWQAVRLHTGDPVDSTIMIRILGTIDEPLDITPRRLFLGLLRDSSDLERSIQVSCDDGRPFSITRVESKLPFIEAVPERVSDTAWRIRLALAEGQIAAGDFEGHLEVLTDFQAMERFTIGVYGKVSELSTWN